MASALASTSSAQPSEPERAVEAVEVLVTGGDECIDAPGFLSRVRRRTARVTLAAPGSGARQFVVSFASRARVSGLLLVREADGSTAERRVSGESCAEVVEALALVAAVAVDPDAAVSSASADAETEVPAEPARPAPEGQRQTTTEPGRAAGDTNASDQESRPLAPVLPLRSSRTSGLRLEASRASRHARAAPQGSASPGSHGAAWSHGIGPATALLSGMEDQILYGLGVEWWSMLSNPGVWEGPLLTATGYATLDATLGVQGGSSLPPSAAVRYRLYGAELAVCPVGWRFLSIARLFACVSGQAGGLVAVGDSMSGAGEVGRGAFAAAGLGLRLLVRVAPSWALTGAASVGVPLVRPVIKLHPDQTVAESADLNLFSSLGVSWSFP